MKLRVRPAQNGAARPVTRLPVRTEPSEAARTGMIATLNQQLADTIDLYTQTKHAHWNVRGAEFYQVHILFDKLAEQMEGDADLIAERAGALGGQAFGTARMSAARSRLEEYPAATGVLPCVRALAKRYAALGSSTRQAMASATTERDAATADLLTQVSRGLDGALWLLESHLQ